jgi:hypothetical protein
MMTLDSNNWYVRLFHWSLKTCDGFTDRYTAYRYEGRTNLCHFMRVILVYMPLVWLIQILTHIATIGVLIILPIRLFGFQIYVIGLLEILIGSVVSVVGYHLIRHIFLARRKQRQRRVSDELHEPTFIHVVVAWIKAKEKKICPIIEFKLKGEGNAEL